MRFNFRIASRRADKLPDMSLLDASDLLASGSHRLCGCQQRVIAVNREKCASCTARGDASPLPLPAPPQRRRTMSRSGSQRPVASTARTFGDGSRTGAGTVRAEFRGSLDSFPGQELWVVAHGVPITQGSVDGAAGGRIKRANGPELHAWRNTITRQACMVAGDQWTPVNGPVQLAVCLTVPWPSRRPFVDFCDVLEPDDPDVAARIPPMGPPDVDKLLRAVQDALSPNDADRFHVLADDARIVDAAATCTFPSPEHTHPWALPTPGAVIRVGMVGDPLPAFPPSVLSEPGPLPAPAAAQHESLARTRW